MREATGRALRITELRKLIEEAKGYINKKKLIAELCLAWNVSERKVKEYVELLITTEFVLETPKGLIKTEDGKIGIEENPSNVKINTE